MAALSGASCGAAAAVFMTPGEEYMFLSATLVREISVMGGDVSQFVSPVIAQRLKQKIQGLGGR